MIKKIKTKLVIVYFLQYLFYEFCCNNDNIRFQNQNILKIMKNGVKLRRQYVIDIINNGVLLDEI